jgi:hypothetical protein
MAIEDWLYDFDPADDDSPQESHCRDCGRPIIWYHNPFTSKWVPTTESGKPHDCPAKRAHASDFPKLEDI